MTDGDRSREEVPMTAELVEEVTLGMAVGRDWTFEDMLQLPNNGRRYEIVDGSLRASPAPTRLHQRVAHRLTHVLEQAAPRSTCRSAWSSAPPTGSSRRRRVSAA
jgi:hypothetical protein